MDSINDILSSLSDEDMENLRAAAESIFSGEEKKGGSSASEGKGGGMPDFSSLLGNAEMLGKLGSIMNMMNKTDSRTRLIEALKPLLSERRRKKADEAMQLIKLLEIMPMLSNLMGGDNGRK